MLANLDTTQDLKQTYCNSWTKWPVILAPDAASGWPNAMAPPAMLVMSLFRPNSLATARNCGAKASLTCKNQKYSINNTFCYAIFVCYVFQTCSMLT